MSIPATAKYLKYNKQQAAAEDSIHSKFSSEILIELDGCDLIMGDNRNYLAKHYQTHCNTKNTCPRLPNKPRQAIFQFKHHA